MHYQPASFRGFANRFNCGPASPGPVTAAWVRAATIGVLLATGCASEPLQPECVSQTDCASGFTCLDGACVVERLTNPEFDAGQRPDAGRPDAGRPDAGTPDAGQPVDANVGICGPAACEAQEAECGSVVDDCGATIECPQCASGSECGTGEFENQCQCISLSCEELGAQCFMIMDNCGNMKRCGSCPGANETCRNNQCECVPRTCPAAGAQCGAIQTGCGGNTRECGTCPATQVCGNNYRCACPSGQRLCNGRCAARCGQTFTSAGNHTYRVPNECRSVRIKARGAGGGHGGGNTRAAAGGYAHAEFNVTGGQTLTVVVGSQGRPGSDELGNSNPGGAGGTPGGGRGGRASGLYFSGGGGGGYSGVFRGGVAQGTAWIIAGGGAGSGGGSGRLAGAGGGVTGQNGDAGGGTQSSGGAGGSTAAPGAALRGGAGQDQNNGDGGGGGGAGYFGGGGGRGANSDAFGGGGGSGFIASGGRNRALVSGSRGTPPVANDPARGRRGEPQFPGLASVDCL